MPIESDKNVTLFALAAFIVKHNLTGTTTRDLIDLIKALCPDDHQISQLSKQQLFNLADLSGVKMVHYCRTCNARFPEDPNTYNCITENCPGLRYKGGSEAQMSCKRQPYSFFVMGNVATQLTKILERQHMWTSIQNLKSAAKEVGNSEESVISDLYCAEAYQNLVCGGFLESEYSLSGIFNTDGVELYSSSKVKLWPIYVAINEIPIQKRFSRENMIIAGLWQGKGQPPYLTYIKEFAQEIKILFESGTTVNIPNIGIKNIKFGVFLSTLDLPAKCKVLSRTQYNGAFGCSTCEESGGRISKGRGTVQFYPYRSPDNRPVIRNSNEIKRHSMNATPNNRIKGIMGISGLESMPWFDLVLGIVPDYMHGVLLGATKTLMYLWFSPTQSKQPYFIGKHLKKIGKRFMALKPTDDVERLPRDLEKHYQHFKAAEYQAFLLYYGIPCLKGYLKEDYLHHFALLSEGIHILLCDTINSQDISRAEILLDEFYEKFAPLYGQSNCGLNIHNIGFHLTDYVRCWGPLYCWSAFGFEDINGQLLNSAHGTGDVTLQLLRMKEIHNTLQVLNPTTLPSGKCKEYIISMLERKRAWKGMKLTGICKLAGPFNPIPKNIEKMHLKQITDITGNLVSDLVIFHRLVLHQEKYYSKDYTCMKKRICYFVLLDNGEIAEIQYFVWSKPTETVYAFVNMFAVTKTPFPCKSAGHHLISVMSTESSLVVPVTQFKEKLLYLCTGATKQYICRRPNLFGHGVIN